VKADETSFPTVSRSASGLPWREITTVGTPASRALRNTSEVNRFMPR